jgi:PmbA protein
MASSNPLNLLTDLINDAKKAGADAADAIVVDGTSVSVTCRLGKLEHLERSEGGDIGLRVFKGKRQAIVSSADRKPDALKELVARAVSMAATVPEDPYCGIADTDQLIATLPTLDICDPTDVPVETLINQAETCEAAARAVKGVTNSEGASASWGRHQVAVAASNGFARAYESSGSSLSASVLAGDSTAGMETDYDYTAAVYFGDLRAAEDVGRSAGERAVNKLGGRKIASQKIPIIYDPRVARGIVSHFVGGINGAAVARGTTFLKDLMGKEVFNSAITITEDPHRDRGLRSKPCDAEGLANHKRNLADQGVLTTWLMDLRAARQLALKPTGHASRGTGSPPGASATNIILTPGELTPSALMSDVKQGLYVTDLVGQGVNMITGDYSRGAMGYWIENGEIAYPVHEVTVAGNLKEMFAHLTPANDLEIRYGIDSPTLRIDGMSVAGT